MTNTPKKTFQVVYAAPESVATVITFRGSTIHVVVESGMVHISVDRETVMILNQHLFVVIFVK